MELITVDDKEVFTKVSNIATELRELVMRSASFRPLDWYQERLNVLTGCFMYLCTRFAEARTARDNNEISSYIKAKMDSQASGDKFVSAVGEREARNSVNNLVEAEKVLESYKEASEQGILTCKKIVDVLMIELERESRQ
jgi:hypothetical protein